MGGAESKKDGSGIMVAAICRSSNEGSAKGCGAMLECLGNRDIEGGDDGPGYGSLGLIC